jgi:hypothetical protein
MNVHWFWLSVTIACMACYSIITAFVAFKGAYDIRGMLSRLKTQNEDERTSQEPDKSQ